MHRVRVIDSHTEGEPTRIVLSGGPDLGSGPIPYRRDRFREEHDSFRRALVNEPRGSDVIVGGLLVPPLDPGALTGVIFFNNVGYLGMCGHGTMGLIVSLDYAGRLSAGPHSIETPVGTVRSELHSNGSVSVQNVESRCYKKGASLTVAGYGSVVGDVAWGGNWFFLVDESPIEVVRANIRSLTEFTKAVQAALNSAGWTGDDGGAIDHVEVSGPAETGADSRNFVLCPGGMYDRSPCGTGTSAKLATLHARGLLGPRQVWRQQGILGGIFEGVFERGEHGVVPTITGRAFVTADSELILDDRDPYRDGFSS